MKSLVGYTDRLSVLPGEEIAFKVSSASPSYRADIVRIVHGDENAAGPGFREQPLETSASSEYPGRVQPLRPGSYVIVPSGPPLRLESFTVCLFLYPTTPAKGVQGLVTRWAGSCGWGLFLSGTTASSCGSAAATATPRRLAPESRSTRTLGTPSPARTTRRPELPPSA